MSCESHRQKALQALSVTQDGDADELERVYERGRQGVISSIEPQTVRAEVRREIAAHPKFAELKRLVNSAQPGGRANRPAEDYLKARAPLNTAAGRRIDSLQGLICNALGLVVSAGREIDYEKTGAGRALARGARLAPSILSKYPSLARRQAGRDHPEAVKAQETVAPAARSVGVPSYDSLNALIGTTMAKYVPRCRQCGRFLDTQNPTCDNAGCGLRNSQQRPPVKWPPHGLTFKQSQVKHEWHQARSAQPYTLPAPVSPPAPSASHSFDGYPAKFKDEATCATWLNNESAALFGKPMTWQGTDDHRGDYYYMAVVCDEPQDAQKMNNHLNYILRGPLANGDAERLPCKAKSQNGQSRIFFFAVDGTKSRRDDFPAAITENLYPMLRKGTPKRKTHRVGNNTKGTRAFEGIGKFNICWSDGIAQRSE
jgi:hypothetical protein